MRPLSPLLHTHTHTRPLRRHRLCSTISVSTSHQFADSLPFTVPPCLSRLSLPSLKFVSSLFFSLCFFPPNFSQQLRPLSCRPFTSLWLPLPVPAVNSSGSWKHKHVQAQDEPLSHDSPSLPTNTTSLSSPLQKGSLCVRQGLT